MSEASRETEGLAYTGIEGLDNILSGGLAEQRLYLVEGNPGSGKTTMALQFLMEGARRGERGVYFSLSETKVELHDVARSHGWNLEGVHIQELTPTEEILHPDGEPRMFNISDIELAETTHAILSEIERTNPRRVVLDSLSELRLLAQNPWRYRRQILALKQFFIGRDCTVLLLDDNSSESADLQVRTLVHGVILLEHTAHEYGGARRRLRVVKLRGKEFRGGYHDIRIRKGGLDVFPRLVASEHRHEVRTEHVQSGIPQLDVLLGGGVDRGTSVLLVGPAGTGKSSIATQYVATAAARGEPSALFLFDESVATMLRRSRGLNLELGRFIDEGIVSVQPIDPAEMSPGEFIAGVRASVEEGGARIVVIDSLNGYLNAMPGERHLAVQLHELLTYLGHLGVVTFLVATQQGLVGGNMQAPVDTSYLADTVIMIRFFEASSELRRTISVVKKRSGGHERTLRELTITGEGIHIGEPIQGLRGVLAGTPTPVRDDE